WACSCVLSAETARVPSETSIAWRSDKVAPGVVLSAVVFTVIVERSWRSSSTSRHTLLRRRDFDAEKDALMATFSFGWVRVRLVEEDLSQLAIGLSILVEQQQGQAEP